MKTLDQWKIMLFVCGFNLVIFVQWLSMEAHLSKVMVKYPSNVYASYRTDKQEEFKAVGPYLVNSGKCKIPNLDPMDPSVGEYFKPWSVECDNKSDITFKDGSYLRINWTVIKTDFPKFTHCEYTPFHRARESDKRIRFETLKLQKFTNDVEVKEQFIHVGCFSKKTLIYTNYHSFVFKKHFEKMRNLTRLPLYDIDRNPAHLNVLMIGIDAVSRMNFIRHMNKTREFLTGHFNSVDLKGYNKIEDNTFLNLVGMLTGHTSDDVNKKGNSLDKLPFVWKDFANDGYVTMYAEENTGIGPFNYLRKGFRTQPTDFYLRPYMLAVESNKRELNHNHCFRNKMFIEIIFDYVGDFLSVFRHNSHFGFVFLGKLTHEDPNGLSAHDDVHFRFLSKMEDKNLLANTVLIYFSDHGTRSGMVKNTLIGKYEERLPVMMISVPKWIQDGRPELHENLKNNADKLTSNFDIYATLLDILAINYDPMSSDISKKVSGVSLFRNVPKQRTCTKANIPALHCACAKPGLISIQEKLVQEVAWCLLLEINKTIKGYETICEMWKLEKVKYAEKAESPDEIVDKMGKRQTLVDYLLIIATSPGNAMFKGTVRMQSTKKCRLIGEIQRTDTYEKPDCILNEPALTEFCVCKNNNRVISEKWKYTNKTFW